MNIIMKHRVPIGSKHGELHASARREREQGEQSGFAGCEPKRAIIIDIRALQDGKISGVTTYITNVLHEIFRQDAQNQYILFANGLKPITLPVFDYKNVRVKQTRIPNKLLNLSFKFFNWPKIDRLATKKHVDLVFTPDPRLTPVSKNVKHVATFHDLSFKHYPQNFSLSTRLYHRLLSPRKRAKMAHHIIAVSDFTKNDLVKTYKIPEEKISTIHEGVDGQFEREMDMQKLERIKVKYHLPNKFFLALFTLNPRKNIHGLIKAFELFQKENQTEYQLVIAGAGDAKLFNLGALPRHPDVIFTGFVTEEDKAGLYTLATAFIYPSFYEGFGLPVLEAMKCETPVIVSKVSALPEVVGEGNGILVDPYDIADMARAMSAVIQEENEARTQNAYKRALGMSWEKTARAHLNLFNRLTKSKKSSIIIQ